MSTHGPRDACGGGRPRELSFGTRSVLRARNGMSRASVTSPRGSRWKIAVDGPAVVVNRSLFRSMPSSLARTSTSTEGTRIPMLRETRSASGSRSGISSVIERDRGGSSLCFVDRAVRERVGDRVLFARDVRDGARRECREQRTGLQRERLHVRVLDLPTAAHLFDDELRVHARVELVDAPALRLLEPDDESLVFRDVVRRHAEELRELRDDVPVCVEQHCSGARETGIPARGPVGIEDRLHPARNSAKRARSTLPPDTIETTRSPFFTGIRPASSAGVAAAPAGSATSLARSNRNRMPSMIVASEITTTSATRRWQISRPRVPAIGAARPSAIVLIEASGTGLPSSSARLIAGSPSGSTPMMRAPFRL